MDNPKGGARCFNSIQGGVHRAAQLEVVFEALALPVMEAVVGSCLQCNSISPPPPPPSQVYANDEQPFTLQSRQLFLPSQSFLTGQSAPDLERRATLHAHSKIILEYYTPPKPSLHRRRLPFFTLTGATVQGVVSREKLPG